MSSLKLTIRCVHQGDSDLKIDAKSDWTVRQLKIYLSDIHPSKPAPERQRIVFAGQLLRDEARLAEYFQRYQNVDSIGDGKSPEPYVLHLVYTTSVEANVAAAEKRANENELRQRKPFTPATNSMGDQNQRTTPAPSPPTIPNYYQFYPGQQFPTGSNDAMNEWMRQQQQMYAIMSQWYGQYLQAYGGGMSFYPASPIQQPTVSANVQQPSPEPVVQQQQQEIPQGQPAPQPALNAQGGVAAIDDEDDPRNRDWLDYMYMGCRAGLLLMILYFYSSIERFVFVILCCAVMYGFQAGWFGRRGQAQEQQQPGGGVPQENAARVQAQNVQVPNQDQVLERNRAEAEHQQNPTDRPVPTQNAIPDQPMTAWNVFWTTCWTFISSFFASLVPERAPPLNL